MRRMILLPLCLAFIAISGCGNKGPLYMPRSTPKPAHAHHAAAPAHASTAAAPANASSTAAHPSSGN